MKRNRKLTLLLLAAAPVFGQPTLFAPRTDIAVPGATCSAIIDVNNDGRPDIAVGAGNLIYLLVQNSGAPGTFANQGAVINIGSGNVVVGIAAADFNEDGKQDLIVSTNNGGLGSSGSILFYAGSVNGTFQPAVTLPSTAIWGVVQATDLNNDHRPDFVVAGPIFAVAFIGDGAGNFPTSYVLKGGGSGTALAIADFNKDGKLDVAFGKNVFLGNGNGSAGILLSGQVYNPNTILDVTGASFIAAADFNGDGAQDIAEGLVAGEVGVALGNGNGTFQSTVFSGPDIHPVGGGAADFNFDGRPDIVELEAGSPGAINIVLGTGGGQFQATPLSLAACSASQAGGPNAITIGDLNGDGAPDVIASCAASNTVSLFLSLTPSVFLQTSANPSAPGQNVQLTAIVGSPAMGFLYTSGFSVQFYDGSTAFGAPLQVSSGQAIRLTNTLAQGIHFLTAVLLNGQGTAVSNSGIVTQVVAPSSCAPVVTSNLNIVAGGFRRNPVTGQYSQTVTMTNASSSPVAGPLSVALGGLSSGVTALNADGVVACGIPAGAPFIDAGLCPGSSLGPGQSLSVTLQFSNPSNKAIAYTPAVMAGYAPR